MIKFKIIKPSLKNKKAYILIKLSTAILKIYLLVARIFSFAKIKSLKKGNTAFTMIELSVVILVIALLMFGSFSSSGMVNSAKERVTKDRMKVIYNAMGLFLENNKRLPCPASIKVARGNAEYGKEVRDASGNCYMANQVDKGSYSSSAIGSSNLIFGMVPVYELKLGADFAEDAFGNKINYFIDQKFAYGYLSEVDLEADLSNFDVYPSFGTAPYKDIFSIKERRRGGEVIVNSDAIIVLMSAGANCFGAYKNTGIKDDSLDGKCKSPVNAEELENGVTDNIFNKIFYNNFESEEAFDDIIFFKTRNDFVNNFNLKSLIPCKGADIIDADFEKKNKYYGGELIASACPLGNESIKKTIKCDAFGKWIQLIVACPQAVISTCTVGGSAGMKSKIVNGNTGGENGECEVGYKGSYIWSCNSAGVATSTNNCIAYCVFATENGMQGLKGSPGESGEGSCSTGFTGYYSWACPPDGLGGTITVNNCTSSP
jgi:type II secretory pathway pseudopilin PulG